MTNNFIHLHIFYVPNEHISQEKQLNIFSDCLNAVGNLAKFTPIVQRRYIFWSTLANQLPMFQELNIELKSPHAYINNQDYDVSNLNPAAQKDIAMIGILRDYRGLFIDTDSALNILAIKKEQNKTIDDTIINLQNLSKFISPTTATEQIILNGFPSFVLSDENTKFMHTAYAKIKQNIDRAKNTKLFDFSNLSKNQYKKNASNFDTVKDISIFDMNSQPKIILDILTMYNSLKTKYPNTYQSYLSPTFNLFLTKYEIVDKNVCNLTLPQSIEKRSTIFIGEGLLDTENIPDIDTIFLQIAKEVFNIHITEDDFLQKICASINQSYISLK